jgi:hypothetical protein
MHLEQTKTMINAWGSDENFVILKKLVREALHEQP